MKTKNLIVLDIECLPNYFLIAFKGLKTGKLGTFEIHGEDVHFDVETRKRMHRILSKHTSFGYNSINYDMPLINHALSGKSCKDLHMVSKAIIESNNFKGLKDWQTYKQFDIEKRAYDHFDVQEPSPAVMVSLKNYMTRIGSKKLQDFYLDPHEPIAEKDIEEFRNYCENDLDGTIDLYKAIESRINLRIEMGKQYSMDLRSKSDAQIAEAVIVSELKKQGIHAKKPTLASNYSTSYVAPTFIEFETPELQELLNDIENIEFKLDKKGSVELPADLKKRKIKIGNTVYKLGIGGLHSQEKKLSVVSDEENVMRNADFTSYYPFIILLLKLFPKHLGEKFLEVYRNIVETRLKAKAEIPELKRKIAETDEAFEDLITSLTDELYNRGLISESLKITINGSFGKLGSKYSKLCSPDLMLATTLTGQLTLLMIIEQMEKHGIPVVSSNTDGLEYFCPRSKVDLAETIIFDLELVSGFNMEHGEYKALHARDVNNYVAIYDGYAKAKGVYAEQYIENKNDPNVALKKGIQTPIVFIAIKKYLLDGTAIAETIKDCKDMNFFVAARTVKGSGLYDDERLGKMVRWYYSTESKGCITYATSGNKVPKTDGCKPMMQMSDSVPSDVDYDWYVNEAIDKLKDLGVSYE